MSQTPEWAQPGAGAEESPGSAPTGWSPEQPPPGAPGGPGGGWRPPASASGGPPGSGWGGPPPGWGGPPPGWTPPPPKPGIIPLRPLGVGELLDGAISAMRANPRPMLGLTAIVAAASQVIEVPLTWLLMRGNGPISLIPEPATTQQEAALEAGTLASAAISVLVQGLAMVILSGILTVVVSRAVLGERLGTTEAWEVARQRIPPLLGLTVLYALILGGAVAVPLAPGVIVAAAGGPGAVSLTLIGLAVPLAVGLAVWLYVLLALAPPAVVLEKQPITAALRRSSALVRGAWWRTFGLLLLVSVIAQVLSGIVSVPFVGVAFGVGVLTGDENLFALLPLMVTALGTIVGAVITWPFLAAATVLIYVDRRMRREGLDLELARAAGLPPVPPATPGAPGGAVPGGASPTSSPDTPPPAAPPPPA